MANYHNTRPDWKACIRFAKSQDDPVPKLWPTNTFKHMTNGWEALELFATNPN